jgi:hypothetical protein
MAALTTAQIAEMPRGEPGSYIQHDAGTYTLKRVGGADLAPHFQPAHEQIDDLVSAGTLVYQDFKYRLFNEPAAEIARRLITSLRQGRAHEDIDAAFHGELVQLDAERRPRLRQRIIEVFGVEAPDLLTPDVEEWLMGRKV